MLVYSSYHETSNLFGTVGSLFSSPRLKRLCLMCFDFEDMTSVPALHKKNLYSPAFLRHSPIGHWRYGE